MELMILMISEMFCRSALVMPESSCATTYHKRITGELVVQLCAYEVGQEEVTVVLEFHLHRFRLFYQLDLQFAFEELHHLFQQKWWFFVQDCFHCVLYQLNE